jgi:hypothetical protein
VLIFRKHPTSCRLARVLLDDLVRREEEHGPDETLHRYDELSDPLLLRVPAREPGVAHGLMWLAPTPSPVTTLV